MNRESLCETLSLDVLLLFGAVLSTFFACCSFFFGCSASAWSFYVGFGFPMVFAALCSWRQFVTFAFLVGVILSIACVTVTYTGTDALICYVPMQRLIINGWNPVRQGLEADLLSLSGGFAFLSGHIQALPRFTAVLGALVSKVLGTFTGDAFLGLLMGFCLVSASWRFGRRFFRSRVASIALALVSVFCTKITSFMAGQIDYTIYASVLIAVYAAAMWQRNRKLRDLLVMGLAMSMGFSVKASGAVFHLSLLVVFCMINWKSRVVWTMAVAVLGVTLVLCWSPYVINILANGTPMPQNNLTPDFTGNADALSMGWVARVTYAWISQTLAINGCSLWYHEPTFHPVFNLNVGGLGVCFRVLLVGSIGLLLLFSRRNLVWGVCLFIFVSANLLPVKYVGFARYQYQMWVIPWLALLNVACNPYNRLARVFDGYGSRFVVSGIILMVCLVTMTRTLAYGIRMYRFEESRCAQIANIRASSPHVSWALPQQKCAYTLSERLKMGGVVVSSAGSTNVLCSNGRYCFPGLTDQAISNCIEQLNRDYPVCDKPSDFIRFKWFAGNKNLSSKWHE